MCVRLCVCAYVRVCVCLRASNIYLAAYDPGSCWDFLLCMTYPATFHKAVPRPAVRVGYSVSQAPPSNRPQRRDKKGNRRRRTERTERQGGKIKAKAQSLRGGGGPLPLHRLHPLFHFLCPRAPISLPPSRWESGHLLDPCFPEVRTALAALSRWTSRLCTGAVFPIC